MKKKYFIFAVALCLVVALVVAMTACDLTDKLKDLGGDDTTEDNTGDNTGDNSGSADASFDYEASAATAALERMQQADGYLIRYDISELENTEATTVTIGAKGNIYYVANGGEEYYYDVSSDTEIVYYHKSSADADWEKDTIEFSEYYTKEDATEAMNAVLTLHSGWLTYYQGFLSSMDGATKSSGTVAGRSCDKYTFSAAALTGTGLNMARANYECYVDKSTSICLKWSYTITADGKTDSWTMECTEFNTNPRFVLPAVEDNADVE